MKVSARTLSSALTIALFIGLIPAASDAGLLDQLNQATQALQKKTQEMQQNSQTSSQTSGKNCGALGAACLDYMETANHCMDPLQGYRAKLTADLIDKKLQTGTLPDAQRKNLQEDLVALREAEKNKTDTVNLPNEKNSQRYLMDISKEDQVAINTQYGTFYNEIMSRCNGADHMGIGKTTQMNYVKGGSASSAEPPSATDALKQCMDPLQGLRWKLTADKLEAKLAATPNLPAQERKAWEADIASVRNAGQTGLGAPNPVDANKPMRYMERLSSEEQMAVNQDYMTESRAISTKCTDMANASSDKIVGRDQSKGGGLVDHSKSPSNPNAQRQEMKEVPVQGSGGGGSLSSSLGATDLTYLKTSNACYDPLKGHLAKVTADTLEAKLKASSASGQKRKEWEEDIAAWRAAAQAGADQATPPDPNNPYRWYDYLSKQERAGINQQHAAFNNKIVNECANQDHMGVGKGTSQ